MRLPPCSPDLRFLEIWGSAAGGEKIGVFWLSSGGNAQKCVHFRGPPRAPQKRGYNGYTKGESPPQAENFGDFGPLKC